MSKASYLQRQRVVFSGRVQGVGFRYNAHRVAERFNVSGFVKNLPNGTVEMVVEGQGTEIDRFRRAIEEQMSDFLRESKVEQLDANNEFEGFEIRT